MESVDELGEALLPTFQLMLYSSTGRGTMTLEHLVKVFERYHHLQLDHTFKSLTGNWHQNL